MSLMKTLSAFVVIASGVWANSNIADSHGPALYVGYGNLFGGIGSRFEYQIKKDNGLIAFTPTAGIGLVATEDLGLFGWNTGFLFEIGHMHRGFLGVTYGALKGENDHRTFPYNDSLEFTFTEYNVIVGPSINLGYKGMANNGLCWSASIGVGEIDNPLNTNIINGKYSERLMPVYSIGLGYKF